MEEDPAITRFREYLRIPTVHPDPDYSKAIEFLSTQAKDVGLDFKVVETAPGKLFGIMSVTGTNPALPAIGLYSHIDVVPVYPEHWEFPPFSAEKKENGDIYARGSQDMKCVGMQYVEAIRRLKKQKRTFLRTIHIIFGPDEEIGGPLGMKLFVETLEFKQMNLAFTLDEGIANPGPEFRLFYGERSTWWVTFHCKGKPGHGSAFIQNTAGEKLTKILSTAMAFRAKQEERLAKDPSLSLGDAISVNFTMAKGGVQHNVVPAELSAGLDIRVPPTTNLKEFEEELWRWCKEAGEDITLEFVLKADAPQTVSTDMTNPWWAAFKTACDSLSLELKKEIFPAGTDSRFFRQHGIQALGFSPMNNTPILLHDHNEFLNENVYLRGIDIYCEIIPAVANVAESCTIQTST